MISLPSLLPHPSPATQLPQFPIPTSLPVIPMILVGQAAAWSCASTAQLTGQVLSDCLAEWTWADWLNCLSLREALIWVFILHPSASSINLGPSNMDGHKPSGFATSVQRNQAAWAHQSSKHRCYMWISTGEKYSFPWVFDGFDLVMEKQNLLWTLLMEQRNITENQLIK